MLVGNKLDLVNNDPSQREVSYEIAQEFAAQEGLMFIETSAVGNNNVRDAFEILLQEIYNQRQKMPKTAPKNPLKLDENNTNTEKKSCC